MSDTNDGLKIHTEKYSSENDDWGSPHNNQNVDNEDDGWGSSSNNNDVCWNSSGAWGNSWMMDKNNNSRLQENKKYENNDEVTEDKEDNHSSFINERYLNDKDRKRDPKRDFDDREFKSTSYEKRRDSRKDFDDKYIMHDNKKDSRREYNDRGYYAPSYDDHYRSNVNNRRGSSNDKEDRKMSISQKYKRNISPSRERDRRSRRREYDDDSRHNYRSRSGSRDSRSSYGSNSSNEEFGVYLLNIARGVTNKKLSRVFSICVDIIEADVAKNMHTGAHLGFGFIKVKSQRDADKVLNWVYAPRFRDEVTGKMETIKMKRVTPKLTKLFASLIDDDSDVIKETTNSSRRYRSRDRSESPRRDHSRHRSQRRHRNRSRTRYSSRRNRSRSSSRSSNSSYRDYRDKIRR